MHIVTTTTKVFKRDTINLRLNEVNRIEKAKAMCACVHIEGAWRSGVIAPFIPKLDTRWWRVCFTWWPLYHRARALIVYWRGGCAPEPIYTFYSIEIFLYLQQIATRSLYHSACSRLIILFASKFRTSCNSIMPPSLNTCISIVPQRQIRTSTWKSTRILK